MAEGDGATRGVQPHDTRVVVWDVPATIDCGETFSVKIGVKCSAACRPDGWTVEVRDHDGNARASATTSSEPWADTAGLHYAQVALRAPETDGLYTWEARGPVNTLNVPHAEGVARFGVRAVPTAECLLTVIAVDGASQRPVQGAKVVAHPYKTLTDEHGIARVKVPVGEYRLFVSGHKYFPFRRECHVTGDVTIRADLAIDRELSDADIWT